MMISKAHTCSFKSIDQTRRATIWNAGFIGGLRTLCMAASSVNRTGLRRSRRFFIAARFAGITLAVAREQ